jgi:hypothetical protein
VKDFLNINNETPTRILVSEALDFPAQMGPEDRASVVDAVADALVKLLFDAAPMSLPKEAAMLAAFAAAGHAAARFGWSRAQAALTPNCALEPRDMPRFESIFGGQCAPPPWSRMWPPLDPPKAPKRRQKPPCCAEEPRQAEEPRHAAALVAWPSSLGPAACGDPEDPKHWVKPRPLRFILGWNGTETTSCYNPGDVGCGATISGVRARLADGRTQFFRTPWSPFWGHYRCSWIGPADKREVGRPFPARDAWTGRPWFMPDVCGALALGGAEMRPLLTDLDCYQRRWNKKAQRWELGAQTKGADGWEPFPEGLVLIEVGR